MTRRPLLVAAALLTLAATVPSRSQDARLPLRNLLVEVRQGEASTFDQRGAGIDQRGATLDARSRSNSAQATQQLLVINGGSAALNIGTSTPLQWLSWVWTPNGPRQVGSSSTVDTGRSVQVRPSWAGGDAPVTVELRSASSTLGQRSGVEQANTLSTLAVPLGQWITVASGDSGGSQRDRGLLSANDSTTTRGFVVELRVTAP